MNSAKRIGLVGCGLWGRNILRDLRELGCLVQVAEPSPDSRERASRLGAVSVFESPDDFGDVDGLVVATPATTHARVVERLLHLDRPIFVEKPLTTDLESAERLVALAGDRLFVMHNWRYHAGIRALAAIASSGELGPVTGLYSTRMNWTSPRKDTDTTWTLLPHDLSIALAILGTIPPPHASVAEVIDGRIVGMTALLGDKPWMVISVSNRVADKRREVRLHCRHGVASLPDGESGSVEITTRSEQEDGRAKVARRPLEGPPPLYAELQLFVDFLHGGPPPPTSAREGVEVVRNVVLLRELAGLDG